VLVYELLIVIGRREKVRFKTGFKCSKSEMSGYVEERIPVSSKGKRRFSTGKNSKKITVSRSQTSRWPI